MFDIGFSELLLIAVVALLVIGPERLPGAIKTASVWLGRLKRSYNDIKREVELELHNNEVMENLKRAQTEIQESVEVDLKATASDTVNRRELSAEPEAVEQRTSHTGP